MAEFTIDDLVQILRECAGEDESVDLDGDIAGTSFEDLGYDSLALFNTISRIERDQAIKLDDNTVVEAKTPRDLLQVVNRTIRQTV
jgi:act minimal PKS acyl carrier protein